MNLLPLSIAVAAKVPVLLWGPPGSGKTSSLVALAKESDLHLEVVIASIREPSDFAGLPVVSDDGSVHFAAPSWARRLGQAGTGVLFLDELSTAPPAVQAALLRVVLERTVGDLVLPDDVRIVAAANPPDQAADGWDLSAPLANRFCHLDWTVDARAWGSGLTCGFDVMSVPVIDDARLDVVGASHRARIAGFVTSRPALLSAPPVEPGAAGRAWPSPRTWTMASVLAAAADLVGADRATTRDLLTGAVGAGPAIEYLAWLDEASLPDPEEALLDPDSFVVPARGDRAYAALSSLVAAVRANPTPERWSAAWSAIAAGVKPEQSDLAVAVLRPLIALRPDGAMPPAGALAVVTPVLRDAGLLDRLVRRDNG